jgi:hypothetical protein
VTGGTNPAPPPPTQAAVALVDVSFREVSAVFDLFGRRRVLTDKGTPYLKYDLARFDPRLIGGARYGSDTRDATSRVTGGLPGVYQHIEIDHAGNATMTFSRAHAKPIAGKWVYMFTSTDEAGGGMKLEAEMYVDGANVQLVDLSPSKSKHDRVAGGAKRTSFQVEVRSIAQKKRWHWFLLAPYQIAWGRLMDMVANGPQLACRCHRLFDELWTDGSDGSATKPLWEWRDAIAANKPMSFVVYLVDPLAEGTRRAAAYNMWLDYWRMEATALGKDEEYRLAKRFHTLPPQYANKVWNKLGGYLEVKEKEARPRLALASATLEDLLWWIGRRRRRITTVFRAKEKTVFADTMYVTDGSIGVSLEKKGDTGKYNAFSEMVADYGHPDTPDDICTTVASVVSFVKSRLDAMPDGQAFLGKIMKVALDGKLPLADGGASMLFEAKRKTVGASAEIASLLLERYATAWVAAYRSEALPSLIAFAKKRLALELKQRHSHDVTRALASIERRAANKAAKGGIDRLAKHYHIDTTPTKLKVAGLTDAALQRLALGFEAFNLAASVQALREEKDAWAAIGLLGSTIDAYSAISAIHPKLEKVSFTQGGRKVSIDIGSKLSYVSSAIDVLLAARDAVNSTDPTEKAGHVMRTMGAYLTLGGTIFAATPAGAVLTVVGLALQAIGAAFAAGTDDLALLVAHSRWGTPPKMDNMMGIQLDGKAFGYTGKLVDLPNDIAAQHTALDFLLYAFKPKLRVAATDLPGGTNRLFLSTNAPKGVLGPEARWKIDIAIVTRDGGRVMSQWGAHLPTADVETHVLLSSSDEFAIVQKAVPARTQQASINAHWGKVRVKGTIQLDVFGDGRSVVTRKLDEALDLPF